MNIKKIILVFGVLVMNLCQIVYAQKNIQKLDVSNAKTKTLDNLEHYTKVRSFTTEDGLPSNHIYKCLEDDKHFLWLATDNGLVRFDGKVFQTFTTQNGLPDNEVLNIVKDKEGVIWVNCFKNKPCYFEETSNRFIIPKGIESKYMGSNISQLSYRFNDVACFINSDYTLGFKHKQLAYVSKTNGNYSRYRINNNLSLSLKVFKNSKKYHVAYAQLYNQTKRFDSIQIQTLNTVIQFSFDENSIYSSKENWILKTELFEHKFIKDSINIEDPIFNINAENTYLSIITNNGKIKIYNKKKLKLFAQIEVDENVNTVCKDHLNNIWVGTLEKGLILYKSSEINILPIPEHIIHKNFISITALDNHQFLTGNLNGEVLSYQQHKWNLHKIIDNENGYANRLAWIRKNLVSKKQIFTFSDAFTAINYKKIKQSHGIKNAVIANDSTLLIVGIKNPQIGLNALFGLNTKTKQLKSLNFNQDRAHTIAKYNDQFYYIGTLNGLVKYDYVQNVSQPVLSNSLLLKNRILDVAITTDKLVIVATASNELVILFNDSIIQTINYQNGFNKFLLSLETAPQQIWVGTREGISIIKYEWNQHKFSFHIDNLTTNDGLPSNIINDLSLSNDEMLAATDKGIASIPTQIKTKSEEIPLQLRNITINQKEQLISNHYKLKQGTKFINLIFSAINLNGNFSHLIYAVSDSNSWNSSNGNNLNLQLENGVHTLYAKAVDKNGLVSQATIVIVFDIHNPIYRTLWFWILFSVLITTLLIWWYSQRKIAIAKRQFLQQLALDRQRLKLTADLHDDIGSSLSSLQVNSLVASKMIDKNPQQAKIVLEKIENQSKKIAENLGDMIWSMKPGQNEFMTMSNRIKTFATDILGSSPIQYTLDIDRKIDTAIQDFALRKNAILIIKEAINNAVKYSEATEITIRVKLEAKQLELSIKDNGIGMDQTKKIGNGLANMKKRTVELMGKMEIITAENQGTEIKANIPIPIFRDKR